MGKGRWQFKYNPEEFIIKAAELIEVAIRSSAAENLTFVVSTGESDTSFEMRYEDENIWLTQKMMTALYDVGLPTVNEHIKKIYFDRELTEEATIRKFRIVQTEGRAIIRKSTPRKFKASEGFFDVTFSIKSQCYSPARP